LEQLRGDDYQPEVATEMVDAHLRSLEQGHMTGIASNDEETGPKPGFAGILALLGPGGCQQKKLTQLRQTLRPYGVRSYGVS